MKKTLLIGKDQSKTELYLVQRSNEMVILTKCCDVELVDSNSGFFCSMCNAKLHGNTTYAHNVDLNLYIGQFGPDQKPSQKNWASWIVTWFGIEEGSIELLWPSE